MKLVARRIFAAYTALLISFGTSFSPKHLASAQTASVTAQQAAAGTSITKNANNVESTLVTYPPIDGLLTSPDFAVQVNGVAVWTERVGGEGLESLNVANFSCAGPQTITITGPADISNCII